MVEPIRILHLITDLGTGGAQTAVLRLLAGLDRRRFSPAVACFYDADTAIARQIRALDISVIDLRMTSKWRWDALWRLYCLLRREPPVILHTWMFHANFVGRVLGRLAHVPVIVTSRRNVEIGGTTRELLNRWTVWLDDAVVAVCELARQTEIERARIGPEKVVTIYNGLDAGQFAIANPRIPAQIRQAFIVPIEAPLLGSIGRLHRQKGLPDLLVALAQVQGRVPGVRLLLIGEGELRGELESQASALGLSETMVFAGARTDVPAIMAALDVLVLPSLWEGLPNIVLEAMAAGLPVVATNVGGTPEVVVEGVTGLLVPPGDPDALAQSIARLLCDPDLRCQMGQAARERVVNHFSVERTVEQTSRLYEHLLVEKGILEFGKVSPDD